MSNFITYKNTNIHYTLSGKGTAVVLLHGFLENTLMWQGLQAVLNTKYKVIAIDLLGHGKSDNLGDIHTMPQMANVVKAVLDHLQIQTSFLVGHSMGGYVALSFAEKYVNSVKGLVLLNSTTQPDSEIKKIGRDRAIAVVKQNHKSFIRTSIPMLFRSKYQKMYSEQIAEVKKQALITSQQGVIAALEGMKIREDKGFLLQQTTFPKMMILGKRDPVLTYKDLLAQTHGTGTEMVELENGHMSLIEDREEAEQAILAFLNKH